MKEMTELVKAMIAYDKGDAMRIHHFLKVYELARTIGREEKLAPAVQFTLETAALVHDIGIHKAEEKYGSSMGKYQELEGPAEAEALLNGLGWPAEVTARAAYLVGHHHTYTNIDGADYQILVEADFLVNLYEDAVSPAGRAAAYRNIFRTAGGKALFALLYPEAVPTEE